jgi:hypothetical protein
VGKASERRQTLKEMFGLEVLRLEGRIILKTFLKYDRAM